MKWTKRPPMEMLIYLYKREVNVMVWKTPQDDPKLPRELSVMGKTGVLGNWFRGGLIRSIAERVQSLK